jgi:nucleotide-binding universal stress UspA family protein
VYAVYVIEVARSLPLDADMGPEVAEGERILQQAEAMARQMDIVDEAIERGVEAIIMGVEVKEMEAGYEWPTEGKPRPMAPDIPLGRVARYVLQHAPCEVWLIRRPLRRT